MGPSAATVQRARTPSRAHGDWNRTTPTYRTPVRDPDSFRHPTTEYEDWLRPFFRLLARGSEVLDLACGCGVPDARLLAQRFRVTGIDISDIQTERARRLVPSAHYVQAKLARVRFSPGSFAGIVCLYSLIHVSVEEQPALLARMYRWLQPGGILVITTGEESGIAPSPTGMGSNTLIYHAPVDAATYARWLRESGFEVLRRTVVSETGTGPTLFLARKPDTL
jgi:ubiquinone/menaquinone biosynthesis C-methylase UbiE